MQNCALTGITAETHYIEFGVGDGTTCTTIGRIASYGNTSECFWGLELGELTEPWRCAVNLPIGATLYARGRCDSPADGACSCSIVVFG
jgi:hypothetical protein